MIGIHKFKEVLCIKIKNNFVYEDKFSLIPFILAEIIFHIPLHQIRSYVHHLLSNFSLNASMVHILCLANMDSSFFYIFNFIFYYYVILLLIELRQSCNNKCTKYIKE